MNKIENKKTNVLKNKNEAMYYADFIEYLFTSPIKEGLSIKQMRDDIDIINAVTTKEEFFELSDTQLQRVKQLLATSVWSIRHVDIVKFMDYLEKV